jgi:hypothetical protein
MLEKRAPVNKHSEFQFPYTDCRTHFMLHVCRSPVFPSAECVCMEMWQSFPVIKFNANFTTWIINKFSEIFSSLLYYTLENFMEISAIP